MPISDTNQKNITFEPNEPVLLNYTKDDLEPLDFGASGIVLESPFKEFTHMLDDTFYYFGTIKEYEDICIINRILSDGTRLRPYTIHKTHIKKHPNYEKCGKHWVHNVYKYKN